MRQIFLFSINGFSNTIYFPDITSDVINRLETWARNDLIEVLTKIAEHKGLEFNDGDKMFFYGAFAGDTASFRFLLGDRMVIHRLVKHVHESKKNVHAKKFQNVKRKLCPVNCRPFFWTKFAEHNFTNTNRQV